MIDYETAADRMLAMGYRPGRFGAVAEPSSAERTPDEIREAVAKILRTEGRAMTSAEIGSRLGMTASALGQWLRVRPEGVIGSRSGGVRVWWWVG